MDPALPLHQDIDALHQWSAAETVGVTHAMQAASNSSPVPGGDQFAELQQTMMEAAKPLSDQVAAGQVPQIVVNLKPSNASQQQSATDGYIANQCMLAIAQLYSSILNISLRKTRGHPDAYKFTDPNEVLQAYADQADCAYQVMTRQLAGIYYCSDAQTTTISKSYSGAEFHADLLGILFKGLNLSQADNTNLDKILTNFAQSISNFDIEEGPQQKTVNYVFKANAVPGQNLGDDNDPIIIYNPKTTLTYLKISVKSWKAVMSKLSGGGGAAQFDVEMTYQTTQFGLNMESFSAMKPKFEQVMNAVTGQTLEVFGAQLQQEVMTST